MKSVDERVLAGGHFEVECFKSVEDFRLGKRMWKSRITNKVVNVGLQSMLDASFSAGAQVSPWYLGLTATAPTFAAGDTMAGAHAGWTEFVNYDEATRQEYVEVRTNQTESNTVSKAVFTISTNGSVIGGAFLVSVATKGGATGTLLCGGAFDDGDKPANDGYVLQVTYAFTLASST